MLGAAVLLGLGLAVAATRLPAGGRRSGRGALARSGGDVLLVGLAAAAVLGLGAATAGTDPVLVAAPALVLLAGAALLLRVPPLLAGLADRRAARSRSLMPVLVAGDLARRSLAAGAAGLLVLTTAATVAALGVDATWRVSQADQAALQVGTDLAVPAVAGVDGAAVRAATGGTVSPVSTSPVSLGTLLRAGGDGAATQLVAVDTAHAGAVLRGRLPAGSDWATVTADLVPAAAPGVSGPGAVTVAGTVRGFGAVAVPTVVLADPTGARTTVPGPAVPLDGVPHDAGIGVPADRTVVAVLLDVSLVDGDPDDDVTVPMSLEVTLPGAAVGWSASAPDDRGGVTEPELAEDGLRFTGRAFPLGLSLAPSRVVLAAAPTPARMPVLLSGALADALGATTGDRLTMTVGETAVDVAVAGVVPAVPSVPGGPAVLADGETLARALLAAGDADVAGAAWWVGGPRAGAPAALAASGLDGARTRSGVTDELRSGPLQVGLPVALGVLAVGALVLLAAASALQVAAVRSGRRTEVARLMGTGVPRRVVRQVLVLQHGVSTVLAVLLGAVVGVAGTVLVGPALTGSPVPAATVQLPWGRGPWRWSARRWSGPRWCCPSSGRWCGSTSRSCCARARHDPLARAAGRHPGPGRRRPGRLGAVPGGGRAGHGAGGGGAQRGRRHGRRHGAGRRRRRRPRCRHRGLGAVRARPRHPERPAGRRGGRDPRDGRHPDRRPAPGAVRGAGGTGGHGQHPGGAARAARRPRGRAGPDDAAAGLGGPARRRRGDLVDRDGPGGVPGGAGAGRAVRPGRRRARGVRRRRGRGPGSERCAGAGGRQRAVRGRRPGRPRLGDGAGAAGAQHPGCRRGPADRRGRAALRRLAARRPAGRRRREHHPDLHPGRAARAAVRRHGRRGHPGGDRTARVADHPAHRAAAAGGQPAGRSAAARRGPADRRPDAGGRAGHRGRRGHRAGAAARRHRAGRPPGCAVGRGAGARGSLPGVGADLLVESAVLTALGVAVGLVVGVALAPGPVPVGAAVAGVLPVAAAGLLALPVLGVRAADRATGDGGCRWTSGRAPGPAARSCCGAGRWTARCCCWPWARCSRCGPGDCPATRWGWPPRRWRSWPVRCWSPGSSRRCRPRCCARPPASAGRCRCWPRPVPGPPRCSGRWR
ncbi:hypothetical protein ACFQX8_09525 [Klenkia terrae]|uniref:hypothetical protein n=1 Tax=Klenkia terrae TaxID=1052259 RepID=UPI00361B6D35